MCGSTAAIGPPAVPPSRKEQPIEHGRGQAKTPGVRRITPAAKKSTRTKPDESLEPGQCDEQQR